LAKLQALLDALCEETLTSQQLGGLEALLLAHPEAEAYYVQYMSQQADLARYFAAQPCAAEKTLRQRLGEAPATVEVQQPALGAEAVTAPCRPQWFAGHRFLWTGLAALAGAVLAAALLTGRRPVETVRPRQVQEALDSTVAVLLQAYKPGWESTGMPTQVGAALPPGRLRLKSGFAHIQFYSGAMVVLEGPADFQLISRTEAFCARGKLRATVPAHAQGFAIGSPQLDLVDRGTEFGLQVNADNQTEVQVFQGKVDLYDSGSNRALATPKALTSGHGVRQDRPGEAHEIPANPAAFLTAQELAARSQQEIQVRQQSWLTASQQLRKDPSLLAYYTFQPEHTWSQTLADQVLDRQEPRHGTIVGCTWAQGRWSGKSGLEFKGVSDRVRLNVPGAFDSITLMAWVRVDALPNGNNSLMMSDGWDEGGVHWQIGESGKLILGVRSPAGKANGHYHAFGVFTAERMKRWTHLAVVYDAEKGLVTHYIDGEAANPVPIEVEVPLRIGRHWLDVVRYADSGGFETDIFYSHAWRYRDYVIRAFNADKPFDRFVREQIAGDELYPGDTKPSWERAFTPSDRCCKNLQWSPASSSMTCLPMRWTPRHLRLSASPQAVPAATTTSTTRFRSGITTACRLFSPPATSSISRRTGKRSITMASSR
jgi:hypothetical protein